MIRLNKYIADSGYCSRREADTFIQQGRVTINGRDAIIGDMVGQTDRVDVDGESIKGGLKAKKRIYIALNKPVGITSTTNLSDPTNIVSYVKHRERIFPIGRLDKLSQGLILLTNDGDIVNKILRAGNAHQKEYVVTVDRAITEEFIERMASGVRLDDGVRTLPCKVFREDEKRFRILLVQGLNRQIRRMCMMLHYHVDKLERVRMMNISLKGLATGQWRELAPEEVQRMMDMVENSEGGEQASVVEAPRSMRKVKVVGSESIGERPIKGDKKSTSAFAKYRAQGRKR
ncbi:MAG: 23S rRNA pseudouridine(2604) synthase RluF [Mucinivorans sp.]